MPDAIFAHPLLAQIYDAFDGDRHDLVPYIDLVRELRPRHVLDLGCGTGSFSVLLAQQGFRVTGVDPAAASLDVAHSKDPEHKVNWVEGDAATLPPLEFDIAIMTGNVAQVFVADSDWMATLRSLRAALIDGGYLVFETRRPERRAWEEWARNTSLEHREVPGVGPVERWREVTEVALPLVSFRYSYRFGRDGQVLTSDSTLRFRSRDEVENSLTLNGFTTLEIRDAPDRPGCEYVFIATPKSQ